MDDPNRPLKDYGSFVHVQPSEADIAGHHREHWQDQPAVYIGLRYPRDVRKRRHHRRHHLQQPSTDKEAQSVKPVTPPAQRVQFLLGRDEDCDDEDHQAHAMFCEMEELRPSGEDGEKEWKEIARWIKFEEDVEEGGERWSKPRVATLSLHSLFELRKGILTGTVLLDMTAVTISQIFELMLDQMVVSGQLNPQHRDTVCDVLLTHHRHQHQRKEGAKGLPVIRSLAEIGHRNSEKKLENKDTFARSGHQSTGFLQSAGTKSMFSKDVHGNLPRNTSSSDVTEGAHKFNEHFLKKIPPGAEASNILIGEVDCLTEPLVAFIRLQKAILLADLTEVCVPTRFIFIQLGPIGNQQRYHEVGRSIATLMSDEIFHDVAYKARDRNDLLAGIDEFLDCVTVLPPGEWDPTIRIEPPKAVPSQEKRKKPDPVKPPNGQMSPIMEESGAGHTAAEDEQHGDATLARTGRLFGGLRNDLLRKAPWYLSDFKDALHLQCIASFFFMYFACLTPIITFGGLLDTATNHNIAAMESLVSGAICGTSYHLFAGQPLTVIGSTGPVLVFETIVFKFCSDQGIHYLTFRFWIGMWLCALLLLMVAFDLSALVRYITRFTEESFAILIALIFIFEAFKKLIHILDDDPVNLRPDLPLDYNCTCLPPMLKKDNLSLTTVSPLGSSTENSTEADEVIDWATMSKIECKKLKGVLFGSGCDTPTYTADVFMFSCLLFIGTFIIAMSLKFFRNTRFFPNMVRVLISDFAVFSAIVIMVIVDIILDLSTPKLKVPPEFRPTSPERTSWLVNPLDIRWYWIFAAILPALLATILIFMDQQITAVIVNRKENKLLKGSGYHLDLLIISVQIAVCSLLGTPWFVAATVLSINHIRSLTRESQCAAPGERPKFLGVREQRVTGILVFVMVGLSALMADLLKHIPMPVLYGVFLFMGVSSLKGIQFVQRVLIMFMPPKYQPDYMYLRHVPVRRVHLFTAIQIVCLIGLWVVKTIKQISIIFPLMVLAMCFIRKALDWLFTRHELKWLDDIMPESHKREKEEKKKMMNQALIDGAHVMNMTDDGHDQATLPDTASSVPHAYDDVNISEEVSKTGIWHNLNVQPVHTAASADVSQPRHRKSKSSLPAEKGYKKNPMVTFKIADDDEEEGAADTQLLPQSTSDAAVPPYLHSVTSEL